MDERGGIERERGIQKGKDPREKNNPWQDSIQKLKSKKNKEKERKKERKW